MTTSNKLGDYIITHAVRGKCNCGRCIELGNPADLEGNPHTIDIHFFEVAAQGNPDKEEFLSLVREEFPRWLDGKEHSYIECGADIGSQEIALLGMALGKAIGAWELLTPNSVLGNLGIPKELLDKAAGIGLVTIQYKEE